MLAVMIPEFGLSDIPICSVKWPESCFAKENKIERLPGATLDYHPLNEAGIKWVVKQRVASATGLSNTTGGD